MLLAEAAAAAALAAMAFQDVRTRDIDEKLFLAGLAAVIAADAAEYLASVPIVQGVLPPRLYIILDAVNLAVASLLALLRLYGWGDVAAMLLVAAASPGAATPKGVLPAVMTVSIYSGAATALLALYNASVNIAKHRDLVAGLPRRVKLFYLFSARPVKAEELAHRPGWRFPLNLCGEWRIGFDVYMNPEDVAREVRRAMRRGCVRPGDYIWVSRGLPGVAYIALGYITALAIGDPLEWLIAGA